LYFFINYFHLFSILTVSFVEKPSLDIHQFYAAILDFISNECGYLLQDSPSASLLPLTASQELSPPQQQSPLSSNATSTTTPSSASPILPVLNELHSPRPFLTASGELVNPSPQSATNVSSSVVASSVNKATSRALDRLQALAQHQVEGERRALNISRHFHFLANAIFPVLDAQIGKRLAKVCLVIDVIVLLAFFIFYY
jgi:hypothetical protein